MKIDIAEIYGYLECLRQYDLVFTYRLGFELFPCDFPSFELPRDVPREPSFFESVSLARSSMSLPIVSSHSSWSMSSPTLCETNRERGREREEKSTKINFHIENKSRFVFIGRHCPASTYFRRTLCRPSVVSITVLASITT